MSAQTLICVCFMGFWSLLNHLLNFAAPAAVVALLLCLAARFFWRKEPPALAWPAQAALIFAVGCAASLASLWWFGRDGRMAGYGALVLASASAQWLLLRGWRR